MQNFIDNTQKKEVLIVGGGAIGLCAAYYLAKNGCKVTLLEKNEIGKACSFKNAGLVAPSHIVPLAAPGIIARGLKWLLSPTSPFYIHPRLNFEFLSWLWKFRAACKPRKMLESAALLHELLQASYKLFESLANAERLNFKFHQRGLLLLYRTAKAFEHDMEEVGLARKFGLEVDTLDAAGIKALEPDFEINAVHGTYYRQDGHLDPGEFISALAAALDSLSVEIHTGVTVTGFATADKKITSVKTGTGDYTADEIVLAGGSWSPILAKSLNLKLAVQPGKGYSVTHNGLSGVPRTPAILVEDRVAVTPLANALRFGGTMELGGMNLRISQRRVNAILKAAAGYYPSINFEEVRANEAWAGLRPCTPDGLPLIGRVPQVSNLTVATGHAMLGITLAPLTGKLVAEIMQNQLPSGELAALNPVRF